MLTSRTVSKPGLLKKHDEGLKLRASYLNLMRRRARALIIAAKIEDIITRCGTTVGVERIVHTPSNMMGGISFVACAL